MLTLAEQERLSDIIAKAENAPDGVLTFWHKKFLFLGDAKSREKGFAPVAETFEEKGADMRISDKQWVILREIEERLV